MSDQREPAKDQPYVPILSKAAFISSIRAIPLRAMIELTPLCNLNCKHCYVLHEPQGELMSTEEVFDVLDQMADMGTLFVAFTGGELFVRSDVMDILRHARERAFSMQLMSNGIAIDEAVANELDALGVNSVAISILGASAEVHDAITGKPGSFDLAIQAIRLLKDRGVRTTMKCPMMTLNLDDYEDLKALGDELDVRYVIDPMITPRVDGGDQPLDYRIDDERLIPILSDRTLEKGALVFGTREATELTKVQREQTMCKAGLNMFSIDPYGNVQPCVSFVESCGNVREQPLAEIWANSPLFMKLRTTSMSKVRECGECDLLPFCVRCPGVALLEDGDAFGPSRSACKIAELRRQVSDMLSDRGDSQPTDEDPDDATV